MNPIWFSKNNGLLIIPDLIFNDNVVVYNINSCDILCI